MCEQILSRTLDGKIQSDLLLKWLVNQELEDDNLKELKNNKCPPSDFILYFLNFIHDAQSSTNAKSVEVLQRASTPKKIERKHTDAQDENNTGSITPIIKRSSSLFENSTPHSQTERSYLTHSTPKVIKNSVTANESYTSPLSPLYSRQNFVTPRNNNKYVNLNKTTPKTTPTLCLGDFIVNTAPRTSSSKKKVQRNLNKNLFSIGEENNAAIKTRRINPTSLAQRKYSNASFQKSDNSFTFENKTDEIIDHSNGQRSFLVEERMKIISRKSNCDNSPTLAVTKALVINRNKEIVPLVKLVSYKQQLDVLVLVYNFMLNNNFVINLTSELYFLISLLLSREYENNEDASPNNSLNLGVSPLTDDFDFTYDIKDDTKFPNSTLFGTIHNRVYFACNVLQNQIDVLNIFDRSMLRLLAENQRLKHFVSSSFITYLLNIYENKIEKPVEILEKIQSNVCFISDTDNRDNFPNDQSFHAFRKQRDLFYEILRIWESNHLQDEWNFVVALGGKIKALLNMNLDCINLIHFARLFKAQLLMNTCGSNEDTENSMGENQLSFLSTIPNVDTEKLLRLKSRIVSKQSGSGINSVPIFSGYQEFYHDFIMNAANHTFNRHLNDALISEIVDLNNNKLNSDLDDNDGHVDSSTQNAYTLCIKSLRILAKFLGFLESLPYKNENNQPPQNVISCQIRIRNVIQPGLNLKTIINNSINNKSLILTLPWITKYLSMLDYITLRLSYFEEIISILFEVYCFLINSNNPKQNKNILLLKLCLGWLFELPHFPEDFYYRYLSQKLTSLDSNVQNTNSSETIFLDELDLVDQNVLDICCPYLQNIRKILSDNANTLNNPGLTIKHITPLTAVEAPMDISNKRIQLEDAFLNGQPVSVRKTVEFISERVASASVKQICNEIVPNYKKKALQDLKEIFNSVKVPEDDAELEKLKVILNGESNKFANLSVKSLKQHINDQLKNFSNERITSSVDSLLATDVLQPVKDTCIAIASRICEERVQQWISSHVNKGVFLKDFDVETKQFLLNILKKPKQKPVFALPSYGKDLKHNPNAYSGVELVENVRSCCWSVLEKPSSITVNMLMDLLKSVDQSVNERCDLNGSILFLINKMLVDIFILLVSNQPNIVLSSDVTTNFCSVWKKCCNNDEDLFKTVVCPRNIFTMTHSLNFDLSWRAFEKFILMLLSEKLLTYETFEKQISAIEKNNFDKVVSNYLCRCLETVKMNKDWQM